MTKLLQKQQSDGFGPSFIAPNAFAPIHRIEIPSDRLAARKLLREKCPTLPGVYGWFDSNDRLGYVGKSKALKKRLLSYFSKTVPDPKMNRIRRGSQTILWQPISHELLALLREQELIDRWTPSYNSQGQPTRRRPAFVCISNSAAPNALLQRQLNTRVAHCFGPILGTQQLREAIENLNNVFSLRDCPEKTTIQFNNQLELFAENRQAKCIRYELNTCPAPCAAACSKSEYQSNVERALNFLNGFDRSILDQLRRRMDNAAVRHAFETAAIFRDRLESLSWLDRRLETLRRAQLELNCIYEVDGLNHNKVWLLLDAGLPIACVPSPTDRQSAESALGWIKQIASKKQRFAESPLEINLQMITLSWFRYQRRETGNLISVSAARKRCRQYQTKMSA